MKFDAYLDPVRFRWLFTELDKSGIINNYYGEKIRKTAAFYSDKINIYIDSSDGMNEDIPVEEYCGRIKKIIEECNGKKFIVFKCFFSYSKSNRIVKLARSNNGEVLPFAGWSNTIEFYDYLLPNIQNIITTNRLTKKIYDVGFCGDLNPCFYPCPDQKDNSVGWTDYNNFNYGVGKDTGCFKLLTRQTLCNKLSQSNLKFFHAKKIKYSEYINKSLEWHLCLSPPGAGEYSYRMFDFLALGQIPFMRKNTYDFYKSWKSYIPEVDFKSSEWEQDILTVIENQKYWQETSQNYYREVLMPEKMVSYMFSEISKVLDEN